MHGLIVNDRPLSLFAKLILCLALLAICLIVVGSVNVVSFNEYYFSHPPKRDATTRLPVSSLPAFSAIFFQFYPYSWMAMLVALPWSIYLITRNATTLEHVAIFAACALLVCVLLTAMTLVAIYMCNQTFVFKGQHLG